MKIKFLDGTEKDFESLFRANLRGADLRGANLRGADLSGADLKKLVSVRTIVGDGVLRGYKKLEGGSICEIEIPADAARVGGVIGRKCRAEFARVLKGSGKSRHDCCFVYQEGEIVRPHKWDPNPLVECSGGIHFFITRAEAEAY